MSQGPAGPVPVEPAVPPAATVPPEPTLPATPVAPPPPFAVVPPVLLPAVPTELWELPPEPPPPPWADVVVPPVLAPPELVEAPPAPDLPPAPVAPPMPVALPVLIVPPEPLAPPLASAPPDAVGAPPAPDLPPVLAAPPTPVFAPPELAAVVLTALPPLPVWPPSEAVPPTPLELLSPVPFDELQAQSRPTARTREVRKDLIESSFGMATGNWWIANSIVGRRVRFDRETTAGLNFCVAVRSRQLSRVGKRPELFQRTESPVTVVRYCRVNDSSVSSKTVVPLFWARRTK